MDSFLQGLFVFILLFRGLTSGSSDGAFENLSHNVSSGGAFDVLSRKTYFDTYFETMYGSPKFNKDRSVVEISVDPSSGSGFQSKRSYFTGLFSMDIQILNKNTTGIVTTFYLDSPATNKHDELDFEFLGGGDNNNYVLQTNVFAHGYGNREQRIRLSFDPTKRFHSYKMLWNLKQIVFLVDDIPIRMFKNIPRLSYISQPLQIKGTIWQADWILPPNTKMDWRNGPFKAQYGRFNISGCGVLNCQNWTPTKDQQKAYKNVRQNLMVYDYCTDPTRFKGTIPPECKYNQ